MVSKETGASSNLDMLANVGERRRQSNPNLKFVSESVDTLLEEAERGCGGAMAHLISAYRFELGVPRDPVKAYMWLAIAYHEDRRENEIFPLFKRGDGKSAMQDIAKYIAKDLTPAQIVEAQSLADEWLRKHPQWSNSHAP